MPAKPEYTYLQVSIACYNNPCSRAPARMLVRHGCYRCFEKKIKIVAHKKNYSTVLIAGLAVLAFSVSMLYAAVFIIPGMLEE